MLLLDTAVGPDCPTDTHWFSQVHGTRWLHHVSKSLEVASKAAESLSAMSKGGVLIIGKQSLVRCLSLTLKTGDEEGDSGAVVSSLVQMLVDPYCRTRQGFELLIQKDWLALGHSFASRCRHVKVLTEAGSLALTSAQSSSGGLAPVFLLFLDCTRVLLEQFPMSFEITEVLVVVLNPQPDHAVLP